MISELIDPAILGFILVGVMLFAIFVGFPISFTLIFLGFVFGYLGFGKLVFYLMTLQFSMVMTEQTLAAVETKKADLALIPVENNIAGRVADMHFLLENINLKIIEEHYQKIEHFLLGNKKSSFKKIKRV